MTNSTLLVIFIPPVQAVAAGNFPGKTASRNIGFGGLLIISSFPFRQEFKDQDKKIKAKFEYFRSIFARATN
jgi:hypothetical protein